MTLDDMREIIGLLLWINYNLRLHKTYGIRVIDGIGPVTQGGDANITCKLIETEEIITQITWQKRTRGNPVNQNFFIISPEDGPKDVNGLETRTKFIGDLTTKVGSIQILNVSLSDEGFYRCIFTVFPSGSYHLETTLVVQVPPLVAVTVEVPPIVGEGEQTLATCTAANGKPPAEISWLTANLDGQMKILNDSSQNPDGTTTVRSHLSMVPTRSMYQQEVHCVVSHTTMKQVKTVGYRINVHYPPLTVNVTLGETSSQWNVFVCVADSSPAPTKYTWSRLNDALPSDVIRDDGNKLFLLETADLNGLYVCEASNQYGRMSGSLYVHTGVIYRVNYGVLFAAIFIFCLCTLFIGAFVHKQRRLSQDCEDSSHQTEEQTPRALEAVEGLPIRRTQASESERVEEEEESI